MCDFDHLGMGFECTISFGLFNIDDSLFAQQPGYHFIALRYFVGVPPFFLRCSISKSYLKIFQVVL